MTTEGYRFVSICIWLMLIYLSLSDVRVLLGEIRDILRDRS
jgi:hypothetical protein